MFVHGLYVFQIAAKNFSFPLVGASLPCIAHTRRRRTRVRCLPSKPPSQFGRSIHTRRTLPEKGTMRTLQTVCFLGDFPSRFSEKVVYILHIFRVNKIRLIVLALPFAEGIEMVSIFTSPYRIDIWFPVVGLVVVPCGYSLCIGRTNIAVHGFVASFQTCRLLTRRT